MIEDMALGPDDEEETPKEALRYVRDGLADLDDTLDDIDCDELGNWQAIQSILAALRLLRRAQRAVLAALENI